MASGWWAREEEEGSLELTRGNVGLGSYSGCLSWRVRSCPWLCSSAGTIGPEYFANSSHSCAGHCSKHFIAVVYSLSHAQLFDTPWTSARQASLSFTISWSLPKLRSIKLVIPFIHLIIFHPLLLPSVFPSFRVFSNELTLHIRWPKYWSFSFSISPTNEYSRLISFRIDWFELLAVQGTLKSLLQQHNLETLYRHEFSSVQFSRSVMSDSLRPHESQHARPPYPSPTSRVHPDSRPSSWWCHPAISSSEALFFCPQSSPASRDFSSESAVYVIWPKYWSFNFSVSPSNENSGLISLEIDWFELLAVQDTLRSLLQHHSLKVLIKAHTHTNG